MGRDTTVRSTDNVMVMEVEVIDDGAGDGNENRSGGGCGDKNSHVGSGGGCWQGWCPW